MRSDQFTIIAQYLCSEMGLGLIRTRLSHDNLVPFRSNLKKPKNRSSRWGSEFYFLPEFLFILVRKQCKNLKPYDTPFWNYNIGGKKNKKKSGKIPKIVATYVYASSQG